MNPLYNMLMGGGMPQQATQPTSPMPQQTSGGMRFANPIQKMNYILEAMRNPAAFVKRNMPGIPDQILNDPNQVLQYMQQNYGVTNQDIQQAASQIPNFRR